MKIATILLLATPLLACCQNKLNVDYTKPLEEHVESVEIMQGDTIKSEEHAYYTYEGDSLAKVVYFEDDSALAKIYEFVWEDDLTKCVYITQNGKKEKVMEEKFNSKKELVEKTVFRTFHYDFGTHSLGFWGSVFSGEMESHLIKKFNDKGLCVEQINNFQPGWTNVEKYIYEGKTKTTLFERYRDTIRIDTSDFFLRGKEEVFYDDNFTKLKSTKDLHKDPQKDNSWEEYDYYPNDSIKTRYNYEDGKLAHTSKYQYDDKWRLLSGDGFTYDYKNFTKEIFGIKVKYLDENLDKLVYSNIMGMEQKCTYDEFKRPLIESLANGTTTNPDFDATYTYNGNVTTILRHERGLLDGKGEKNDTKKIKIVYREN
ncbi:MAG: hypothetical protein J6Z01_02235 [Bacteroidales bacterium]|nr:hypothetical protein [Bacteroidales bacterium]